MMRGLRLFIVGIATLVLLWLFRVPLFSWTWWIWLPTGIGAFLLLELAACNLRARPRLAAGLVAAVLLALFLLQPAAAPVHTMVESGSGGKGAPTAVRVRPARLRG
jgi:hypothetical protein